MISLADSSAHLATEADRTWRNWNNLIGSKTKIVAVTHVSNALGSISPIKSIITLAKKNNSLLPITEIVDQYYGDVQKLGGNRWDTSSLIRRLRK